MTRYGHVKAQRIGRAATPSASLGAGMSRMRVALDRLVGLGSAHLTPGSEAIAAATTPPSGSVSRLEGDDQVVERSTRRLVGDPVLRAPRPGARSRATRWS